MRYGGTALKNTSPEAQHAPGKAKSHVVGGGKWGITFFSSGEQTSRKILI